jgi:hypothetical protein
MWMEKLGYLISEIPPLFFVAWFAVRFFQFRRRQRKEPLFSDADRALLFGSQRSRPASGMFYLKLILAITIVATLGLLEIVLLAPFGAAILTGALVLTSTVIVRNLLAIDT